MLNTTLKRRLRVLALITILSVSLATAAFAVSKLIKADEGGTIDMAEGIALVIPPKALEEDTVIQARVVMKQDLICYKFRPGGIILSKPAKLVISRQFLEDAGVEDLNLYDEDGGTVKAQISKRYAKYRIEHFSIYYHRKR